MHYYEVAPLKIIRATSKSFTYHWPEALPLGQVVQVSVGAQQVVGVGGGEVSRFFSMGARNRKSGQEVAQVHGEIPVEV